jgi:hypothetical protein
MTTNAQLGQVVALVGTGELAMEWWRAEQASAQAKSAYHSRIKEYEEIFNDGERIRPMSDEVRRYTQEEFLAFESAKKKAYRTKRKLLKACAKMAEGGLSNGSL